MNNFSQGCQMFAQAVAEEEVDDFAEAFGKGKALKARKEERERENLEKKEKQDKAKVYNSIRSQASRCIPSLAPLRFTLEVHTSEPSFKKHPKVLKQEVTDCAATIVRWITEAETKQKASTPDPLSFSLDELKEFVKGAKQICARLQAA